jgi:hypothetical protein
MQAISCSEVQFWTTVMWHFDSSSSLLVPVVGPNPTAWNALTEVERKQFKDKCRNALQDGPLRSRKTDTKCVFCKTWFYSWPDHDLKGDSHAPPSNDPHFAHLHTDVVSRYCLFCMVDAGVMYDWNECTKCNGWFCPQCVDGATFETEQESKCQSKPKQ